MMDSIRVLINFHLVEYILFVDDPVTVEESGSLFSLVAFATKKRGVCTVYQDYEQNANATGNRSEQTVSAIALATVGIWGRHWSSST